MANNSPVIVDAQSSGVNIKTNSAQFNTQSVPVKIDASQMQSALQALARQASAGQIPGVTNSAAGTNEKINPSTFIKNIAEDMENLYARFDKLKVLAAELNGLSLSSPLPASVALKNIVINFSVTKNGKTEEHSAEIRNVAAIGEITDLMSSEFGMIFSALHANAQQVEDLAKRTTATCAGALKDWEAQNKDKQIVQVANGSEISIGDAATAPAVETISAPTLAAS